MVSTDIDNTPNTLELTFTLIFVAAFFINSLVWVIYSRTTVKRIEKRLEQNGYGAMFAWDGNLGVKSIFLAFALGMSVGPHSKVKTIFIDGPTVNKYATQNDILFSKIYLLTLFMLFATALWGGFVFNIF